MNNEAPPGTCYICGHRNAEVLEHHHIIPRRFGGSDESTNLLAVCPNCHQSLERIYDNEFFERLGARRPDEPPTPTGECEWRTCTAEATHYIEEGDRQLFVCDGHRECRWDCCLQLGSPVSTENGDITIVCSEHRTCYHEDCLSRETLIYDHEAKGWVASCDEHADELREPEEVEKISIHDGDPQEDLWDFIRDEQDYHSDLPGVPREVIYTEFLERGFERYEVKELIESIQDKGEIYNPDQDHVRVV